ncbi:MAG TPA: FAD-dependent oxidoreductase [Clostridia bacterium]|nr:FAD-dependent oxidoreductase [Clostridia bacterium]
MREVELAIIGGGPGGLAAAIEAYRNGVRKIVLLERDRSLGGILKQCVHSGFGLQLFGEELTGPEYAERFTKQVMELGIDIKLETMVIGITSDKLVSAVNSAEGLISFKARALILAMGCRERPRGALNIPGTRPAGIYTAGTAQRFVNMEGYMPGKKVVILGSGDIGLIMARRMTLEGAEVKMVCELMPYSGGLKRNIMQCLEDFGIPLRLSHTVVEIHGRERLEGVTVAEVDKSGRPVPGTNEYVECDTLLLSVGLIPENELSKMASIELDPATSGPFVDEACQTSAEGIFACGNVVYVHDLVDYVTQEGYLAGKSAAEYLSRKAGDGPEGGLGAESGAESRAESGAGSGAVSGAESGAGLGEKIPEVLKIHAGYGVRCIIPQFVRRSCKNDVSLFFRVAGNYRDVVLEARAGGRAVCSVRKKVVSPGEMESIRLKSEIIRSINSEVLEIGIRTLGDKEAKETKGEI